MQYTEMIKIYGDKFEPGEGTLKKFCFILRKLAE